MSDWHIYRQGKDCAQEGRVAELPAPTTQLPRAKPLPKPREPTKWEQFAQRKGIIKHKRSKDVWDDEAGEYKRRFGYKRAGDESEVPIIEAHASDQARLTTFQKLIHVSIARIVGVKEFMGAKLQEALLAANSLGMSLTNAHLRGTRQKRFPHMTAPL